MTDAEEKEWRDYVAKRIPELEEQIGPMVRDDMKNGKEAKLYWWLKMELHMMTTIDNDMPTYYRKTMEFIIECLEHVKSVSKESYEWWRDYFGCTVMDFWGEARWSVDPPKDGPQPRTPTEEERKEWKRILELGDRFWSEFPREYESICKSK